MIADIFGVRYVTDYLRQVFVSNVSNITPTQINKKELTDPQLLEHGDLITIVDRSFRFEFPQDSKYHPNNEKLPCSSKELDLQKSISQKVLSPEVCIIFSVFR